jgi:hypothetical protein
MHLSTSHTLEDNKYLGNSCLTSTQPNEAYFRLVKKWKNGTTNSLEQLSNGFGVDTFLDLTKDSLSEIDKKKDLKKILIECGLKLIDLDKKDIFLNKFLNIKGKNSCEKKEEDFSKEFSNLFNIFLQQKKILEKNFTFFSYKNITIEEKKFSTKIYDKNKRKS